MDLRYNKVEFMYTFSTMVYKIEDLMISKIKS